MNKHLMHVCSIIWAQQNRLGYHFSTHLFLKHSNLKRDPFSSPFDSASLIRGMEVEKEGHNVKAPGMPHRAPDTSQEGPPCSVVASHD
jgi:hypothetical protein